MEACVLALEKDMRFQCRAPMCSASFLFCKHKPQNPSLIQSSTVRWEAEHDSRRTRQTLVGVVLVFRLCSDGDLFIRAFVTM